MIVVSYHDDLKEVQGLWPDYARTPAARTPFDRAEWFGLLAEECGLKPFYALARQDEGIVLLALMRSVGRLEALANWYSFIWRPQCAGNIGRVKDAPNRLLIKLLRELRKQTWRIVLAPLANSPEGSGQADELKFAFEQAGWRVAMQPSDVNHSLAVAGRSFAEYLASRPGPLRTTLKRKAAKVDIEILTRFDPQVWAQYEAIYADSWKPEEGSPNFLRRFAEAEDKAGRLRLGIARNQDQPIAAQFWTVEGNTAYIHKLAHREDAKALSPGTVLTAALLEMVIDRDRVDMVDFGTGDDSYKRDWMDEARPRYRLDALNPANLRAWPHLARRMLRR